MNQSNSMQNGIFKTFWVVYFGLCVWGGYYFYLFLDKYGNFKGLIDLSYTNDDGHYVELFFKAETLIMVGYIAAALGVAVLITHWYDRFNLPTTIVMMFFQTLCGFWAFYGLVHVYNVYGWQQSAILILGTLTLIYLFIVNTSVMTWLVEYNKKTEDGEWRDIAWTLFTIHIWVVILAQMYFIGESYANLMIAHMVTGRTILTIWYAISCFVVVFGWMHWNDHFSFGNSIWTAVISLIVTIGIVYWLFHLYKTSTISVTFFSYLVGAYSLVYFVVMSSLFERMLKYTNTQRHKVNWKKSLRSRKVRERHQA